MEEAHLIVRQQGRGTFVATTSSEDINGRFDRLRSGAGELLPPDFQVLDRTSGTATGEEALHLGLMRGSSVHRVTRLRTARGKPLMVERVTVALEMFRLPTPSRRLTIWRSCRKPMVCCSDTAPRA